MTQTQVQKDQVTGSTVTSVTFDSGSGWATPTSGNLIVIGVDFRLGSVAVGTQAPTGFTAVSGGENVVSSVGSDRAVSQYYKVSDGTESSITVESADGQAFTRLEAFAVEYNSDQGSHSNPEDQSASKIEGAAVTSHTTASITPTVTEYVAVAVIVQQGTVTNTAVNAPYALVESNTDGNGVDGAMAEDIVTGSSAATSATFTWTTTRDCSSLITNFKEPTGAAADPEGSLLHGKLIRGGLLTGKRLV